MNCLLTGIGGQGIVFASKLISQTAMNAGKKVRTAETIGMAQRGGSVVSHVRVGDGTVSPLIGKGHADVIIAFEPGEALRVSDYLAPTGVMIVSDQGVQSPADALTKKEYRIEEYLDELNHLPQQVIILSGTTIRDILKSSKVLNVALVGAACGAGKLDCSLEELEETIEVLAPQKFVDLNKRALKVGYDLAN